MFAINHATSKPRMAQFAAGKIRQSRKIAAGRQYAFSSSLAVRSFAKSPEISITAEGVTIQPTSQQRQLKSAPISWKWLRDSCQCEQCVQSSTKQKLGRSGAVAGSTFADGASTPKVKWVEGARGKDGYEIGLEVVWPATNTTTEPWRELPHTSQSNPTGEAHQPEPESRASHRSFYPSTFLNQYFPSRSVYETSKLLRPVTWLREDILRSPSLRMPYELFRTSSTHLHAFLSQLQVYGLVVLTGVPTAGTSNRTCELRKAMEVIGEIRNTFYGETWDVKAVKDSKNIAYTNVDLGVHQDLCYFESPPRFQALHCLRNRVIGGSSYFCDAFRAAERLREEDPEAYRLLVTHPIPYVYDNDGYYYFRRHPTIELLDSKTDLPIGIQNPARAGSISSDSSSDDGLQGSYIHAINYSPPFQAPLDTDLPHFNALLDALQSFDRLLHSPDAQYEFTMQEGDMVVFDNRRVMHARRAFHDRPDHQPTQDMKEGDATRWLKGCYMDGDVVWNKLRYETRRMLEVEEDSHSVEANSESSASKMTDEWRRYWETLVGSSR